MTTTNHWSANPDWLTDAVLVRWANAVIALLAQGGGVLPHEVRFHSDIDAELIQAVVFPDGEHNILAWITGRNNSSSSSTEEQEP